MFSSKRNVSVWKVVCFTLCGIEFRENGTVKLFAMGQGKIFVGKHVFLPKNKVRPKKEERS